MNIREKKLIRDYISHLVGDSSDELFDWLKATKVDAKLIELKTARKARLAIDKANIQTEITELDV